MENNVLLHFDESYWIFKRFFRECYEFPVVYEDGLISRYKKNAGKKKAWGFIVGSCIVAIHPAVEEMTPAKANDYCKTLRFAGRLGCLPPESVLNKVKRNVFAVNEMLTQLGGTPFEAKWYMAENDCWCNANLMLSQRTSGVHMQINGNAAFFISEYDTAPFYPAVKI